MPNPAAVAYEAYREVVNDNHERDHYLLPWDLLSDGERKAWWAVVRALLDRGVTKPNKGG